MSFFNEQTLQEGMSTEFLQTLPELVAQAFAGTGSTGYGRSKERADSWSWLEVQGVPLLLRDAITPWQRDGLIPIPSS